MSPIPIAGPAVEPVTLAEAKAFLRLDTAHEDDLVSALIVAARHTLEGATGLRFVAQTWRSRLERWPPGRAVLLPFAPLLSVAAVRVAPAFGPVSVVTSTAYRLDGSADPPRLVVDPSAPEPGIATGGIEIDAVYGFGPAASDVPAPLRLAIRRLVASWFERRGDEAGEPASLPGAVRALVIPYMRARLR